MVEKEFIKKNNLAMVDDESLKVIDRFFEVLYDLKARRVIRGKQTFTKRYGIVRWDLNNVEKKKHPGSFQMSWIGYLVKDFGVSAEWLLTGKGDMYVVVPQPEKKK